MSSALFGPEPIVSIDNINTVVNAVNIGQFGSPLALLPSINLSHVQIAYNDLVNEPNMTVHLVLSRQNFKIYFCKANNHIFQIITDEFTQRIHLVELVANPQLF